MKRVLTLLGVFAIGEGIMLILQPRRYLGFWVGAVGDLMALMQPGLIERPQIARLLGMAELGLGLWWVTRRLSRQPQPISLAAEEIPQPEGYTRREL